MWDIHIHVAFRAYLACTHLYIYIQGRMYFCDSSYISCTVVFIACLILVDIS